MQEQMPAFIGLILVLAALAGCLDGDADGAGSEAIPTGDTDPASSLTPVRPADGCLDGCPPGWFEASIADCTALFLRTYVEADQVDPFVPDRYELSASPVTGLVDVILRVSECRQAVLNNETVLQPFRWAGVGILVEVPENVSSEGVAQYMVEYFTDHEEVRAMLSGLGFPVVVATIDAAMTLNEPAQFAVQVNGTPWYEMTAATAGVDTLDVQVQYLHVHDSRDDMRLWYLEDHILTQSHPAAGMLTANDGVLSHFATAARLPFQGSLAVTSSGRFTTGILPDDTHT